MATKFSVFLIILIVFSGMTPSSHARKLSAGVGPGDKAQTLSEWLYLAALPKRKVPESAPSKKGHSSTADEKLMARHLTAVERILRRSVPSPGSGN